MIPPQRRWRSYGTEPLPTPAEALNEMFSAFPSWFLRIECDRCGKVTMINESHAVTRLRGRPLVEILARMRHDRCGGLPGKAELLSGIDGVSSRPVYPLAYCLSVNWVTLVRLGGPDFRTRISACSLQARSEEFSGQKSALRLRYLDRRACRPIPGSGAAFL